MRVCKLMVLSLILLLAGCSRSGRLSEAGYLDFLKENMSTKDIRMYQDDFWAPNVHKALEVRDRMGWDIPEQLWRHYVLPLRVENEHLDNFRTTYADSLCRRVQGMGMYDAVLELNLWCLEQANYSEDYLAKGQDTPMGTMMRGQGDCIALSALLIDALRAVGIPARMVKIYWSHTNGAHAWPEAWVDGEWMHLGASEPSPVLNDSWINFEASRPLHLPVRVFGDYDGPEPVIERGDGYTVVDVLGSYAPQHTMAITVTNARGEAVKDATVNICIYNDGMFMPIRTMTSDRKGRVEALTGVGDAVIMARKGQTYGLIVSHDDEVEVSMSHSFAKSEKYDFRIVPGDAHTFQIDSALFYERDAECGRRVGMADDVRNATHTVETPQSVLDSLKHINVKPHIPELAWSQQGNVKMMMRADATYDKTKKFSITQFQGDSFVYLNQENCLPGPFMVTSGTHLVDGTSLVHCEISNVPDGASSVQFDLHCPAVPRVVPQPIGHLPDISFVNFRAKKLAPIALLGDDERSKSIRHGLRNFWQATFIDRDSYLWDYVSDELRTNLGAEAPCFVVIDEQGDVYLTARNWSDDLITLMTAINNAL